MMQTLLLVEVVLGSLMALMILLQHRASGLSATFGGSGATFVQRRGAEKFLFAATVWVSVAFFGLAAVMMYI